MKLFLQQKLIKLLFMLCLLCSAIPQNSFAAFPIKEQKTSRQQFYDRVNEKVAEYTLKQQQGQYQSPYDRPRSNQEDSGVYGILSLLFAIFGIFPAAIALGVVGMQPNRRLKELATIGLVLGIIEGIIFLIAIVLFIAILGTI